MLGIGDRLTFRNRRCAFKTARGQEIELGDAIACTKPDAAISHDVAQIFADQLREYLQCSIEVLLTPDGFEFTFRSEPNHDCLKSPRAYRITVAMLDTYYKQLHAGEERPAVLLDISKHLNQEGAEAIRWFLLRLHLHPMNSKVDLFPLVYNRMEASWTPPEKPEGYEPLRGKPVDDGKVPSTKKSASDSPALSTKRPKR